jgi:hypothetical protein
LHLDWFFVEYILHSSVALGTAFILHDTCFVDFDYYIKVSEGASSVPGSDIMYHGRFD